MRGPQFCHNRDRHNVLDYVLDACEAALRSQPTPSLLPTSAAREQLLHPAA
jgi:hypothetical protein